MRGRDAHDERLTDEVHVEPRDQLAVDVGVGWSAARDEEKTEKAQTHQTAHTASLAGFKADNRLQSATIDRCAGSWSPRSSSPWGAEVTRPTARPTWRSSLPLRRTAPSTSCSCWPTSRSFP